MKEQKIPSWIGDVLLFMTAVVWGGGFIGVSEALDTLMPFYMIAIRFSMASVLLMILFWKHVIKMDKNEILAGSICGVMLFIGFAFQTAGAVYISVGKLAFLTALNVIMVPFIAAIGFHEKIHNYNIASSLIAIIGFGFLNLSGESGIAFGRGEIYGILCAIGFAMHISVLGYYTSRYEPIKLAVMQMVTCAILGWICAFVFEKPPVEVSMKMMLPVTYLGVCSTFIAFLFQTIGQKYTSAPRAAILLSMESVFGIIFSILILKEQVTLPMMIGAGLIFGAVIMAEYMHAKLS